jgi:hypothetical protein
MPHQFRSFSMNISEVARVARAGLAALSLAAFGVASQAAGPTSVNITGDLQSEAGCASDIDPACSSTNLVYDSTDDVWQRSLNLPANSYSYIATLNGSFTVRYGVGGVLSGAQIPLNLSASTAVKFYYDDKSHWVTDNVNSVIAVLAGSFQSELGCAGDFDPSCLRTWLQDLDGDGLYTFTTTGLVAGVYGTVVAINESFTESYGKDGIPLNGNYEFTVAKTGDAVQFIYDSRTHLLQVQVPQVTAVPEPSSVVLLLAGLGVLGVATARRNQRTSAKPD